MLSLLTARRGGWRRLLLALLLGVLSLGLGVPAILAILVILVILALLAILVVLVIPVIVFVLVILAILAILAAFITFVSLVTLSTLVALDICRTRIAGLSVVKCLISTCKIHYNKTVVSDNVGLASTIKIKLTMKMYQIPGLISLYTRM